MALRRLVLRPLPAPPDQAPAWRSTLDQMLASPLLQPVRLFVVALNDMRPWWPVLFPALLWVFFRTYTRERERVTQGRSRF